METITDIDDEWIRNFLNKIETKQKKSRKCLLAVLNHYLSHHLELLQLSESVLTETLRLHTAAYKVEVFETLNGLNPNFIKKIVSPNMIHSLEAKA